MTDNYKIAIFDTKLRDYEIDAYILENATFYMKFDNEKDCELMYEKLTKIYNVFAKYKNDKFCKATNINK